MAFQRHPYTSAPVDFQAEILHENNITEVLSPSADVDSIDLVNTDVLKADDSDSDESGSQRTTTSKSTDSSSVHSATGFREVTLGSSSMTIPIRSQATDSEITTGRANEPKGRINTRPLSFFQWRSRAQSEGTPSYLSKAKIEQRYQDMIKMANDQELFYRINWDNTDTPQVMLMKEFVNDLLERHKKGLPKLPPSYRDDLDTTLNPKSIRDTGFAQAEESYKNIVEKIIEAGCIWGIDCNCAEAMNATNTDCEMTSENKKREIGDFLFRPDYIAYDEDKEVAGMKEALRHESPPLSRQQAVPPEEPQESLDLETPSFPLIH